MAAGDVITALLIGITIMISLLVFQQVSDSFARGGWSAAANTSFTAVQTNFYNGATLLAVGIIVLAAAAILRFLRLF